MGALLYIGAYTDSFPLTVKSLRDEHTHFMFVDKQPKHDDHMVPRTEADIIFDLVRRCTSENNEVISITQKEDCWEVIFELAHLLYFFNTLDSEMSNMPSISRYLPFVTTLYVHGFTPSADVLTFLPALKTVYATPLCITHSTEFFGRLEARSEVHVASVAESEWENGVWALTTWQDVDIVFKSDCTNYVTSVM